MPAVAGPSRGGKADEIHTHGAPGQITCTCAALDIACQHTAVGRRIMGGPEPSLGVIDPRQHGPVVLENSIRPSWWTSCITSGYHVQVAL